MGLCGEKTLKIIILGKKVCVKVGGHETEYQEVNPLLSSAHKNARIAKILILKLEGTIKFFYYDHRHYESVDEKNLS